MRMRSQGDSLLTSRCIHQNRSARTHMKCPKESQVRLHGVSMPPWDRVGKIVPYARTTCLQDDTPVGGVLGGGDMHSKKRTSVGWRVGDVRCGSMVLYNDQQV